MEDSAFLNKLANLNSAREIFDAARLFYMERWSGEYVPAKLQIGDYFGGADMVDVFFELRLGLGSHKVLMGMMEKDFPSYGFGEAPQWVNVIEDIQYEGNYLLMPHRQLLDDGMELERQTDKRFLNVVYRGGYGEDRIPVIKAGQNKDEVLIASRVFMEHFDFLPKERAFVFCLIRIKDGSRVKYDAETYSDRNAVFRVETSSSDSAVWIRSIFRINQKPIVGGSPKGSFLIDDRFAVLNIGDGEFRPRNIQNYDDDMNAGLIVFNKECKRVLEKDYLFFALHLVPRDPKDQQKILYDCIEDLIVFWEGEFNRFKKSTIEALLPYHVRNRKTGIISQAMLDWQLKGSWNYKDAYFPNESLADYIETNYFERAVGIGISFLPPDSIEEYSSFVIDFFKVTSLKPNQLRISKEKKSMLLSIMKREYVFENRNALFANYQGLCIRFLEDLRFMNGEQLD